MTNLLHQLKKCKQTDKKEIILFLTHENLMFQKMNTIAILLQFAGSYGVITNAAMNSKCCKQKPRKVLSKKFFFLR